ncbi:AAA family ATPase [Kitasatospora sp. NBC_00085]|uniref:AAA family ATPase n=1 Tax=Kitasatospora sp. NBC_00085 TaxID=2903566 RepID=UPI00324909CC
MTIHDDRASLDALAYDPDYEDFGPPPADEDWASYVAASLPRQQQTPGAAVEESDIAEQKVNALLAELLDTADLDSIANLEPLVADMLFLDSLGRMNGPSGHGKSFVALDFAGCVGTGLDWHGRRVRQGLVVYLVAEGARGIRKRVRAWEQVHGRKMTGVKFLPRPVQAVDIEWLVLIEACRRLGPLLIIVDTQARVTVGVEENSNTEMGKVIHRMEQLRANTGACVLLIHHKGLNGDHGRGASAVKGAMQTELTVTKEGKGPDTRVLLATDKQKDSEEIGRLSFWLRQVALDGEAEEDGRPVTSAVLVLDDADAPEPPAVRLSPAARKLLDALRALDRPASRAEVVDKLAEIHSHGLQRETASRELNSMHKQGLVNRIDQLGGGIVWGISEQGRQHSQ